MNDPRATVGCDVAWSPTSVARDRALGFAFHVLGDDLATHRAAAVLNGLREVNQLLGMAQVVDSRGFILGAHHIHQLR